MNTDSKMKTVVEFVVAIIAKALYGFLWFALLLVGWGFLFGYLSMLYCQFQTKDFLETSGVITMNNRHRFKDAESGNIYYELHVRYSYFVEGRQYWNNQASFLREAVVRSGSANIADEYPLGKQVAVFYDPKNPERAVLTRKITPFDILPFLIIAPFAFIGVVPFFVFADNVWNRLRWKSVGEYPLLENGSENRILLYDYGLFSITSFFVLGAIMLCIVFSLFYLIRFDLNTIVVAMMFGFTGLSGVLGMIYSERRNRRESKMLIIDSWNGTVRFPKRLHIEQMNAKFPEIVSIDLVRNDTDDSYFELSAKCVQNGCEKQPLIAKSRNEKSLLALKRWIEKEIKIDD